MEPPPAPMVWMSIIGTCSGQAPTRPSVVTSASPPRTRHTSALVPPTSTEMRSSNPAASPTRRAPITPAAGPDSPGGAGGRGGAAGPAAGARGLGGRGAAPPPPSPPAVGFHDRQRGPDPARAQLSHQPRDVASDERLHV